MSSIAVIGSGYVGVVVALGFAAMGRNVMSLDVDSEKIDKLNKGIPTFYEAGIEEYLNEALKNGKVKFSTDMEYGIGEASVVFLAVGTPSREDGSANLTFIKQATRDVARFSRGYTVVVTKSTVPVGTNRLLQAILDDNSVSEHAETEIEVVSNPEFLREGHAMEDFLHPERVVLGANSQRAQHIIAELYESTGLSPCVLCNWETAELIKYAANCFLATKVAFINEISNLAEAVGADVRKVSSAMGMDSRIGADFLKPGPGYGGSCFPKDTRAILQTSSNYSVDMSIINSVVMANENQKSRVAVVLQAMMGHLAGRKIAVLGLTFKAGTDDVRESASLTLVRELKLANAVVQAHDPKGMDNFRVYFPYIAYYSSPVEALKGADAMVLMVEWNDYRTLKLGEVRRVMNNAYILDTRNLFEFSKAHDAGFVYWAFGRGDLRIE